MNKIYKKIIIISIIICMVPNISNVLAVTQSEINSQKNEQSEVSGKIDDVKEQQEEVSSKKSAAQAQVESLNSQIDTYETEIDTLDSQISDLQAKIKDSEKKIKEDEEQYAELQKSLDERLVAMYENGETTYLDVLLSSSSLMDFISNFYVVSELANYDTEMLKQIEEEKNKIETEKASLEANKSSLDNSKKSKEAKANSLTVAKNEKSKYVAELTQEEAELEKQLNELKSYESSISSKIKQMQAAYDKEVAEAKKKAEEEAKRKAAAAASTSSKNNTTSSGSSTVAGSNSNTSTGSYGFGWPVANPVIGTSYGVSGKYWSSGKHTGIDFRASDNTPVFSIGDGQVFDTGYSSAYGNYVEIYHGNNIYSFYAHATRVQVSVGQKVTKGAQIMLSGHTGNVTGPHLHFEIRTPGYKYANCVNPRPYLPN